jgi:cell wall-associated NlpC family hydrolase
MFFLEQYGGSMKQKACLLLICALVVVLPSLAFAAKTHKVRKNESVYSLARKYQVSVDDIRTANNLAGTLIRKGDVLVIPPRAQATAVASAGGAGATYKVRKGDSLHKIARKAGVSVDELRRLNSLKGTALRVGQVLALRAAEPQVAEPSNRSSRKYTARFRELFSEESNELTLAELADFDPDRPVDLSQSITLKDDNADLLKKKAFGFLGIRYRFGGNSRNGLDCSSFVQQVFREMDIRLPRTAREQFVVGDQVPMGELRKGDLLFFRTYASFPSHVGIYLGDNKMIHASSRDRRVVVSRMNTPYYRSRFIGAKRISSINDELPMFDELLLGVEEETEEQIVGNDTLGVSLNN